MLLRLLSPPVRLAVLLRCSSRTTSIGKAIEQADDELIVISRDG